ncbi:MAG: hypothetical protein ACOC0U_01405, partial [Desulfovibrionales bacterium]
INPELQYEVSTARSSLGLNANWAIFEYSDLHEFDRINHAYSLDAQTEATERLTLGLEAGFRNDETIDVELEDFARLVQTNERYVYTVSPSAEFQLTPRNEVALRYSFQQMEFDDDDLNDDNTLHEISLSWDYLLNERTSLSLTGVGSTHTFDDQDGDVDHDEIAAFAGIRYFISEILTLNVNAGAGRTRIDDDATGDTDYVTRYLAKSELIWEQERWNILGSYQRDITPDLDGESVTRDRLSALLRYYFSERFYGSLGGYYVHTDQNEDDVDSKSDLYRVSPRLGYQLTERAVLEAAYTYSRLDEENDDEEDRNQVSLSFNYNFPIEF